VVSVAFGRRRIVEGDKIKQSRQTSKKISHPRHQEKENKKQQQQQQQQEI